MSKDCRTDAETILICTAIFRCFHYKRILIFLDDPGKKPDSRLIFQSAVF